MKTRREIRRVEDQSMLGAGLICCLDNGQSVPCRNNPV